MAQLVQIGIDHPDVKFEIVYGMSGNKRSWYDNSNASRLGYRPQDDTEKHAEEILAKEKPSGDPLAELYQGGIFARSPRKCRIPRCRRKKAKRRNERSRCPKGACDTHMHFYDGALSARPARPIPATSPCRMYREMQKKLGLERVIVVQPNAYRRRQHGHA